MLNLLLEEMLRPSCDKTGKALFSEVRSSHHTDHIAQRWKVGDGREDSTGMYCAAPRPRGPTGMYCAAPILAPPPFRRAVGPGVVV